MVEVSLDSLLSEIEKDKGWRERELVFFENQLANYNSEEDKKIISKALILLLYASFEGHVKFIFECYVKAINGLNLTCQDVIFPLVASNLNRVFEEFRNTQRNPKNNQIFKEEHNKEFVELGRRVEFLEKFEEIITFPIKLDVNKIVDTESNLSKKVLLKILFRIGFDGQLFTEKMHSLEKLLNFRNAISHGARQEGWSQKEYEKIKREIFELMRTIQENVTEHFSQKKYMKN